MMARRIAFLPDPAGQAIVELAIALPILVFILLAAVDLSRVFAVQLAVQNAARVGAETSVLGSVTTDGATRAAARQELGAIPGVTGSNAVIKVSRKISGSDCFTTVRVRYTFQTIIPWPLIPNVARIDRSTVAREFRATPIPGDPFDSEDSDAADQSDCDDSGGSLD